MAVRRRTPPSAAAAGDGRGGDPATRQRVIDAAVTCILDLGFYRASSNAIARQAGVTWGVIQHYFGTRERLMVAVLRHGTDAFIDRIQHARIDATEPQGRLDQLIEILARHYGQPSYLAYVQIRLNLDQDPNTSEDIRETMRTTNEQTGEHVRRILAEAVGNDPQVVQVVFLAVRSFLMGQLLHTRLTIDSPAPRDLDAERHTLAALLAPYFASP